MGKKVIIFTAEPSNFVPKSLKKAAEGMGIDAQILDVTHCIIAEGIDGQEETQKLASEIYVAARDNRDTGEVGAITKLEIDADTVVIPRLNEYNLEMKISMLQRMKDCGATILNSVESMELCNDKLKSQVTLSTAGIKTPYSFTLQNPDDVEKVVGFMEEAGRLKYPTVVKTLRGTHGIGVMKIDSRSSLVGVAQMLLKEEIEFMIQEFIKHEQSARIIMIGDQVLAANLRGQAKDKVEFRTNSHLGSETEPYTPGDAEVAIGRRIVELFGCNFCAIDYILVGEGEDKEIIILEVNGSPGLEAISKDWPDRDLPKDVIKFAIGDGGNLGGINNWQPTNDEPSIPSDGPGDPGAELPASVAPDSIPSEAIQEVEPVTVHRIMAPNQTVDARIDTGAATCSLHADMINFDEGSVKFKRGDVTFKTAVKRVVKIKNVHNGASTRRPVVCLDVTIHGKRFNQVEFTLTDRSNMKYEVLIGRNVLEQLGLPVLIAKNPDVDADVPESELFTVSDDDEK